MNAKLIADLNDLFNKYRGDLAENGGYSAVLNNFCELIDGFILDGDWLGVAAVALALKEAQSQNVTDGALS